MDGPSLYGAFGQSGLVMIDTSGLVLARPCPMGGGCGVQGDNGPQRPGDPYDPIEMPGPPPWSPGRDMDWFPPSPYELACFTWPDSPGCKDLIINRCRNVFRFPLELKGSGRSGRWYCQQAEQNHAISMGPGDAAAVDACRSRAESAQVNCLTTAAQNNARHCVLSCCLRSRLSDEDALRTLELHECCSLWLFAGSEDWDDFEADWTANDKGFQCSATGASCEQCCSCVASR